MKEEPKECCQMVSMYGKPVCRLMLMSCDKVTCRECPKTFDINERLEEIRRLAMEEEREAYEVAREGFYAE